jgi:hypothetical protein
MQLTRRPNQTTPRTPGATLVVPIYRDTEIKPICSCGELAVAACMRCGRPLCPAHLPALADQRCRPCEEELEGRLARLSDGTLVQIDVALGCCAMSGLTPVIAGGVAACGWGDTVTLVVGAVCFLLLVPGLVLLKWGDGWGARRLERRRSVMRQRFLAERQIRTAAPANHGAREKGLLPPAG